MIRLITITIVLMSMTLSLSAQEVYHYLNGDEVHLRWKGKPDASVTGYRVYQKKNNKWNKIAETNRLVKNRKIKEVVGPYTELYLSLAGVKAENGDFTNEDYQALLDDSEAYNFFGANTVLHPRMAEALGEYVSFTPSKTEALTFEIRSVAKGTETLYTTYSIDNREKASLGIMSMPEAFVDGDKVKLKWSTFKSSDASVLGIRVYRSANILGPFVNINPSSMEQFLVNENAENNLQYVDNYLDEGTYYYYLTQFNMFGFESAPSPIKEVKIAPVTSVLFSDFKAEERLDMVKLSWETNIPNTPVFIYRKIEGESNTELIYPPTKSIKFTQTHHYDRTAEPGVSYVYYLKSASTTSDTIRFSLIDHRKPLPPTDVKGSVSKNGLVKIEWDASASDNITGYHIVRYSGDSGTNAFSLTSKPVTTTYYQDQLDVKSESAYRYAVKAVNQNYIESDPSELIRLRRPDDIPPKTPGVTYVMLNDSIVNLHWTPALEEDFHHYVVYKSQIPGEITRYKSTTLRNWKDTLTEKGTTNYAVSAVDRDNNESSLSETYGVNYIPEFALKPPSNGLSADSSGRIFIQWQASPDENTIGYMIERQIDGEEFPQLVKEIKDGSTNYLDTHVSSSKKVRYFIYAYDRNWFVSKTIEIKHKPR